MNESIKRTNLSYLCFFFLSFLIVKKSEEHGLKWLEKNKRKLGMWFGKDVMLAVDWEIKFMHAWGYRWRGDVGIDFGEKVHKLNFLMKWQNNLKDILINNQITLI